MMKRAYLMVSAMIGLLASCSDETTVFNDPQEEIVLESSQDVLTNSINYDTSGVLDIFEEDNLAGKSAKNANEELAGDYPLTLVAKVAPPSFNGGENLTASHVDVDGNYAYVSYNTVDASYVGGIDVVDISDPTDPRVVSRLYFVNADINSVQYEDGYVYAVGGVDSEKSVRATSNSFIAKIPFSGNTFNVEAISYGFQEGYNATDVALDANSIFVTSGRQGYLRAYAKNEVTVQNEVPFDDLRALAIKDGTIALLDASRGVILLNPDFSVLREIPIDSDFGDNTKRTLAFSGDNIVVSEGSKGAGIYNLATGTLVEYVPILVSPENVSESDIVTNAVATNEGIMLMANGGAGLCLSEEQDTNTDLVGIIALEGSINYVQSKGDYAFAASGREGLQIVKLNKPDQSLEARCSELPAYEGSANLNISTGQTVGYRGSKRFNRFNVDGSLLLCGSWTAREHSTINSDALLELNGTFVIGRNNRRRNITVDSGATFRVEGNLTIYGDLILNDGATLEFIGDNSVVNIFGSVITSGNTEILGTFRDVRDKF